MSAIPLRPRFIGARRAPRERAASAFEIPSLNGIRAIAVIIVFAVHAGIGLSPGPLGVTIFFFLSGYLITTLLRIEYDRTGTIDLRAFYLRRAFRLLPPLYLVLLLANGLTMAGAFDYSHLRLGACLSQFFFLSNYQILHAGWQGVATGRAPGTGSLWSLAVEEHFYLLFPLFYLQLRRHVASPRRQAAVLAGLCAAVLAWRFVLILGLHASFDRTYVGSDTRIDSILFGCILAVVANPALDRGPAPRGSRLRRLGAPVLAPAGVLALLLAYPWPHRLGPALFRNPDVSATVQYTIEGLALYPIFIAAVRHSSWGVFRVLNQRWVVLVGVMSYSIYISHEIIIALVHRQLPGGHLLHAPLYLGLTLLFAWAVHVLVERPFARLRRRLSRIGTPPEPAAAAPESEPVAPLGIVV